MISRCSKALFALLGTCAALECEAGSILLRGGMIHPVAGPTLTNGSVLIQDNRIAAVGQEIRDKADVTVELNGSHVFPGLIALTTSLGLLEIDGVRSTLDFTESGSYTPDVYSWVAVNPDSELIPVARANGVALFEPTPGGGTVAGHSGAMATHGWTIEEMVLKKSTGLHLQWPSYGLDTTPKELAPNKERWKSVEDQVKERDKRLREITSFFDDAEAYAKAKTNATGSPFKPIPAWESMLPVIAGEEPVVLHADEAQQIQGAVEWGLKRKYKLVVAGGRDAWRVATFLSTNSIPVAFGHVFTSPPRDIDPYDVQYAAAGVLSRAGVRVAFSGAGERFGASNVRNTPYLAAQSVAFGMPRDAAIRALTVEPARILGIADRVGTLEPGKDATLFVADGDILDIRSHVTRMWIAGQEVSLASKHTRLYQRYRERPKR